MQVHKTNFVLRRKFIPNLKQSEFFAMSSYTVLSLNHQAFLILPKTLQQSSDFLTGWEVLNLTSCSTQSRTNNLEPYKQKQGFISSEKKYVIPSDYCKAVKIKQKQMYNQKKFNNLLNNVQTAIQSKSKVNSHQKYLTKMYNTIQKELSQLEIKHPNRLSVTKNPSIDSASNLILKDDEYAVNHNCSNIDE